MAYPRRSSNLPILALLSALLFCTGCIHPTATLHQTYTLEEDSGYSLLVPTLATRANDQDFQTSTLTLKGNKPIGSNSPSHPCVIHGSVFSLTPGSKPNQWAIKSLSAQGWQKRAGELDVHAEWNRFLGDLLELERQSCFPRQETFYGMRRAIAERIPLPANEAAFFAYSFGGGGFVDLAPGMQIKIERPLIQKVTPTTRAAYKGSLEADYRVISPSSTSVELLLSHSANRRAGRSFGVDGNLPFALSARFASTPLLRLFLQSIGDGNTQPTAILLGASNVDALNELTHRIEENGRTSCPPASSAAFECISFGTETAVNLLSSVRINGKTELRPFAINMGQLIDVGSSHAVRIDLGSSSTGRNKTGALREELQTASLSRSLVAGGYAEVKFPKTIDAVSQIVLLPGDRLDWEH